MKAKVIVSFWTVIGLMALSAAAFTSTANIQADAVPKQGAAVKTSASRETSVAVMEERVLLPEIPTAELPSVQREQAIMETQIITLPEAEGKPEQGEGGYQGITHGMDWDAEESYMLAKIAMAEAEGEDTAGKALVMLVVLNRVWSDRFPDSIEEVIYEDGQFSPVANGRFDRVEPDEDCWKALAMIEVEGWNESMGATYFESKSDSEWHEENLLFLFQYGSHYFYTDKKEENHADRGQTD